MASYIYSFSVGLPNSSKSEAANGKSLSINNENTSRKGYFKTYALKRSGLRLTAEATSIAPALPPIAQSNEGCV